MLQLTIKEADENKTLILSWENKAGEPVRVVYTNKQEDMKPIEAKLLADIDKLLLDYLG
jgi:hypothetical protein